MKESPHRTAPYRATIVMDSDILMKLSILIPPEYRGSRANSPRDYLGLLPFLARHGYRILIPEMVAFEVAQVLADGTNVNHVFPKTKYGDRLISQPFLQAVARGEFPEISLVANTGPPTVDTYCQTIHRLAEDAFAPHGRQHEAELRRALIATNATKGKEMGDRAIGSLLDTLRQERKPVFVLTNDRLLAQRFPESVKQVGLRPFMHHLMDAGLAEAAGLSAEASAEVMSLQMAKAHYRDGAAHYLKSFLPESTEHFLSTLHNHPSRFLKTLQDVKADMATAPALQEASGPAYRTAAARRAATFSGLLGRGS